MIYGIRMKQISELKGFKQSNLAMKLVVKHQAYYLKPMKTLIIVIMMFLCKVPIVHAQTENRDTTSRFGLHLGSNFGFGFAGGTYGGGGIKLSPRIGVHFKNKFVLGIEYNTDYQIIYLKDSIAQTSISLSRWIGPFLRYNFFSPQKEWNMFGTINYVFGSDFVYSTDVKYRKTYNTLFLGLGCSYRVKKTAIEAGYRYTFLFNNTPIEARWSNTIFLGLTRNF